MEALEYLIKCRVCGGKMRDPRILPCKHSFCKSCLKNQIKKNKTDPLKCPTCFEKFEGSVENVKKNSFIGLLLDMKICGVCAQKEADYFCQNCDKSFCSTCDYLHVKVKDNHTVVKLKFEPFKIQSNPTLFCIDCDQFLTSEFVHLHKRHELADKKEGIKRRLSKWEGEVKRLTECRIEFKECLKNDKDKWSDQRKELLEVKSRLEDNYKELIEVLQSNKKFNCDKIDAKVSNMESEFLEHQQKLKKEMSAFKAAISKANHKIENLRNRFEEGFRDESSYEMLQMHRPPFNLRKDFSFQPIPIEAILQFIPSIDISSCKYELETEKTFEASEARSYVRHDGKFLYSLCSSKVLVHSLEELHDLKTTIQCPQGFKPWDVIFVNRDFYVSGYREKKIVVADEDGHHHKDLTLPSDVKSISNNGSSIIITCQDCLVVSYDAVTQRQETLQEQSEQEVLRPTTSINAYSFHNSNLDIVPTPQVRDVLRCILMVGEEYCMHVRIDKCYKIIKSVKGVIVKSYEGEAPWNVDICTYNGRLVFVGDWVNGVGYILDRNLEVVSSFRDLKTHYTRFYTTMFDDYCACMDAHSNVYLSFWNSKKKWLLRKYKTLPAK